MPAQTAAQHKLKPNHTTTTITAKTTDTYVSGTLQIRTFPEGTISFKGPTAIRQTTFSNGWSQESWMFNCILYHIVVGNPHHYKSMNTYYIQFLSLYVQYHSSYHLSECTAWLAPHCPDKSSWQSPPTTTKVTDRNTYVAWQDITVWDILQTPCRVAYCGSQETVNKMMSLSSNLTGGSAEGRRKLRYQPIRDQGSVHIYDSRLKLKYLFPYGGTDISQ